MQKVLVTGGSGFIGTNLINNLINDDYTILNLDSLPPLKKEHNYLYKQADLLDFEKLKNLIVDFSPEIIVHLAARTDLNGTDLNYYASNFKGTQNLIDIASLLPSLKKVIYTSSMYVCQPGFIPADYDTYKPHTPYGESKVQMELLVKGIKNPAYEWVIIRPTSIWGPWFSIPYIDFFDVVYAKKYFDFGKACVKTYGYVENTVLQIRTLMDAGGQHGKTFYLGDLPPIQISEWADEISVALGKGHIKSIPFFMLKSAAIVGDLLRLVGIKFTMTSFRLKNMTTNNILPLDAIYEIAGPTQVTRKEGVEKTIKWLIDYKQYVV